MQTGTLGRLRLVGIFLFLFLGAGAASAQTVEEFYKNRQISLVIGYESGGTYDTYARMVAPYLAKYLPGNPTIIPRNMPGASSLKAAGFLHNQAPRDGSTIGMLGEGIVLHQVFKVAGVDFDVDKFNWVGRITSTVDLALARPGSPVKTIQDAMKQEVITGAINAHSITGVLPRVANRFLGTRFKIIVGYSGGPAIMIALERNEIDVTHIYVDQLLISRPQWLKNDGATILLQYSEKRHPLLPDVPTLIDIVPDGEAKQILRLYASTAEIGRSYMAPPDVPADRLAAIRTAFEKTMLDPDLKAEVEKRRLSLAPTSGATLQERIKALLATPADIAAKAAEVWNE